MAFICDLAFSHLNAYVDNLLLLLTAIHNIPICLFIFFSYEHLQREVLKTH